MQVEHLRVKQFDTCFIWLSRYCCFLVHSWRESWTCQRGHVPCDWIFKMHSKEAVILTSLNKRNPRMCRYLHVCTSVSTFPFAENKVDLSASYLTHWDVSFQACSLSHYQMWTISFKWELLEKIWSDSIFHPWNFVGGNYDAGELWNKSFP